MVDPQELELLEHSERFYDTLQVVVTGCAHSCCGRGWRRRDGYEQTYCGRVDNLHPPDGVNGGTFMLLSAGIGALSYVIAVRFDELVRVTLHEPSPLAA